MCVCVNYAEKKFYETDTCSQFHKTCCAIINVAIGAFPQVLTWGMLLGGINYAEKKFYETDTCSQFHKTCCAIINVAIGALPEV